VDGLCRRFFLEDADRHLASLLAYDEAELTHAIPQELPPLAAE